MRPTSTTRRTTCLSSSSSDSTLSKLSASSPVKPLNLRQPAEDPLREHRLLEVQALSLRLADLSALETVLREERQHHLEAAAFSASEAERQQHLGVYHWISAWIEGSLLAKHAEQARERLDLH